MWRLVSTATLVAASVSCRGIAGPIGERRDIPPEHGGTINFADYSDIRNLDPAISFDAPTVPIEQLLYTPLVDYDRQGRLVPLLAERFDVSEDGLRISFKLREGALFHDGDEVTANDVKRSIERALDHETPCPIPSFYSSIVGYDAFHNGTKDAKSALSYAAHLEGVVVDGRYALHVELTEPDATFLPAMSLYVVAPICKSAGAKYAREWGNHACGTGPFRLEDWQASREINLVRHQGYFEPGLPYLDRIRWYLLMSVSSQRFKFEEGELDHVRQFGTSDLVAYLRDPRWKPFGEWEPAKEIEAIFMNTQMKPFDNVEFRRAFASAINWQEVTLVKPEFTTASQVIPPAVPGYDPSIVGQTYDPKAALLHMKNAGYAYDPETKKGGYPIAVRFVAPGDSAVGDFIAPMVQQQVARIGIRMEIAQVSYPAFLAEVTRPGHAQLGYGGWSMDYPDPSDFFEPTFSSASIQEEESQNSAFYSNPELDRLLKKAHREMDQATRLVMYRRCEEIIRDDAPWAIGFHQRWYEIVQPYVHGYVLDAKHTEDVRYVWLDARERRGAARSPHARDALASIRPWGRR